MPGNRECTHVEPIARTSPRARGYRIGLAVVLGLAAGLALPGQSWAEFRPEVAIVQCEDSYNEGIFDSQSSSQAMVGAAGLVGVPYRTLTVDQLLAEPAPTFTSIWFSYCVFVSGARMTPLIDLLRDHTAGGGSVVLDGPLGSFYRDELSGEITYRGMANVMPFLGVDDIGWNPTPSYEIQVWSTEHPVAQRMGLNRRTVLTRGLQEGLEVFRPLQVDPPDASNAEVLLQVMPPGSGSSYPFMIAAEPSSGGKVLAIGALGTYYAALSPIPYSPPTGFRENRVMPYLLEALLWTVGPDDEPFAGLQLSHAPVTAVARIDGDWSGVTAANENTLTYAIELAKSTGVATVYGIVSSLAENSD
ncbi:MAG: hypothetical protein AAGC55_21555, partial [Myxococcota bacterium]